MIQGNGKKLSRLKEISPEYYSKLKARGITSSKEFLSADVLVLMSVLSLSYWQLQTLTHAVSRAVAPQPQNVALLIACCGQTLQAPNHFVQMLDLHRAHGPATGFIPTSLHELDATLHGGLPRGTITELAGPPGCGKTQLCVTLSVMTALPAAQGGCGLGVVYIDTEATFSAERLVGVARARHSIDPESITWLANRVKVHQTLTSADLEQTLSVLEEELAEMREGVGLVVVDSIASPVRREWDTKSQRGAMDRAAVLSRYAARLKYLAEAFNVVVVVTNQITTTGISHDLKRDSDWSELYVTAALGNTWAHCVNTRLLLGHLPQPHRILTVGKSPVGGCKSYVVSLEQRGVVLDKKATAELQRAPLLEPALALQVRSDVDTTYLV